ncbi:MAG: hypothetical protein Q7V63_06680 [Gammaproteobacteria bacterium]|nr:hypothetical protein [Gammaproteobacteria bacterium]
MAGLIGMIHPVYSKWIPFIASTLSMLSDKISGAHMHYKVDEFREIAISCIPPKDKAESAEQALYEMNQIMLEQNLPEPAVEILQEVALNLCAEIATKQTLNRHNINNMVNKHRLTIKKVDYPLSRSTMHNTVLVKNLALS